jgi:hypothetical protein
MIGAIDDLLADEVSKFALRDTPRFVGFFVVLLILFSFFPIPFSGFIVFG